MELTALPHWSFCCSWNSGKPLRFLTRVFEGNKQTTRGTYAQEDYSGDAFCCFARRWRVGGREREARGRCSVEPSAAGLLFRLLLHVAAGGCARVNGWASP